METNRLTPYQRAQKLRNSSEVRSFIIEEYMSHCSCARTARVASRYFAIPISVDIVKKHLRAVGISHKTHPSIYDSCIG